MNAFESGQRKVIPAVLVYLEHRDRTLMIHKKQSGSFHEGKWNGLGGKMELNESPLEASFRELKEESGLVLDSSRLKPLGILHFPNFKPMKSEDWLVYVFVGSVNDEEASAVFESCDEGELHWVETSKLLTLALWPGDRYFIPHIQRRESFCGTLWYHDGEVARHEILKF